MIPIAVKKMKIAKKVNIAGYFQTTGVPTAILQAGT